MKAKVMLVSLLTMAGFVFNSCSDDGKTGDTKIPIRLSIYPCTSSNAEAMAEYIRTLYADKLGSTAYSVSKENTSEVGKAYANYDLTVSYNVNDNNAAAQAYAAVKNLKSSILNKMKEYGIWRVYSSPTTFVEYAWEYDQNMAIGTWKGNYVDDNNTTHSLAITINDEFSETTEAGETYTTPFSITKDNTPYWSDKTYYSGNFGTTSSIEYKYEDGVVKGSYSMHRYTSRSDTNFFRGHLDFTSDSTPDTLYVDGIGYGADNIYDVKLVK